MIEYDGNEMDLRRGRREWQLLAVLGDLSSWHVEKRYCEPAHGDGSGGTLEYLVLCRTFRGRRRGTAEGGALA